MGNDIHVERCLVTVAKAVNRCMNACYDRDHECSKVRKMREQANECFNIKKRPFRAYECISVTIAVDMMTKSSNAEIIMAVWLLQLGACKETNAVMNLGVKGHAGYGGSRTILRTYLGEEVIRLATKIHILNEDWRRRGITSRIYKSSLRAPAR